MKIKLLIDLPIGKENGATKGQIFEAELVKGRDRGTSMYYFKGKTGRECACFDHECEIIK